MRLSHIFAVFLITTITIFLISNPITIHSCIVPDHSKQSSLSNYAYHDQIWIQSNDEFHNIAQVEGWIGNGTKSNPYVISGYFFDCESQPLRIWNTRIYWIFIDNIIDGVGVNVQCGTWIQNVTHGSLINNTIYNRHAGMSLGDIEDFIISGNYIHDCRGVGIEVAGGMNRTIIEKNTIEEMGDSGIYSGYSLNCSIRMNSISSCEFIGIALLGLSPDCNITDNIVKYCGGSGIIMTNGKNGYITGNNVSFVETYGISIVDTLDSVLSQNRIISISGSGIRINEVQFCRVCRNTVSYCTMFGISANSGANTSIHRNSVNNSTGYALLLEIECQYFSVMYNSFIDTNMECHISDNGVSNYISYNFYDTWTNPDKNNDGWVDLPYLVHGLATNQDNYPLTSIDFIPSSTTRTITKSTEEDNNTPTIQLTLAVVVSIPLLLAIRYFVKRK